MTSRQRQSFFCVAAIRLGNVGIAEGRWLRVGAWVSCGDCNVALAAADFDIIRVRRKVA